MGNCGSGNPGCPTTGNLGQTGAPPQCTRNFDCIGPGKVCAQYTAEPGTLITSSCGAQQTNPVSGCVNSTSDPTYPNNVWAYSTVCSGNNTTGCCNAICTPIDASKCFAAGGVPAQVCAGALSDSGPILGNYSVIEPTFGPQTFSPVVTCQWDLANFTSLAAVQQFEKTFGKGSCPFDQNYPTPCPAGGIPNVFDQIIMPFFCSQQETSPTTGPTSICPPASNAGNWIGNKCSRFVSNNAEGLYCQKWLSGVINDPVTVSAINTAQTNYCNTVREQSQTDPTLEGGEINECLCLNRNKGGATGLFDETVAAIANAGVVSAQELTGTQVGCWYAPCNGGAIAQLIPEPAPLISPVYYPTSCPNVCQIIIDNRGKIVGSINNTINCAGNAQPTPPGNGQSPIPTVPVTPSQPPGSGGGTTQSFWEKYKWWIIGFAIVVIIIIFFIFFGVIEYRKKHEQTTELSTERTF